MGVQELQMKSDQEPSQKEGTSRDPSLDILKGFAIFCVVLGHSLNRGLHNPNDNILFLLLTAFEMPLFMFLSGFVLSGRVRNPRRTWLAKRALRLMVPFFVWQFIYAASSQYSLFIYTGKTLFAYVSSVCNSVLGVFMKPALGLWYLPALVICSAILVMFYRFSQNATVFFFVPWLLLIGFAAGLSALGISADFGIQKTATFWPFFAGGYLWATRGFRFQSDSKKMFKLLPTLGASLYPAIAIIAMQNSAYFSAIPRTFKTVLGFAGIAASVIFMRAAEPLLIKLRFEKLGAMTLGIYCVHWLFLRMNFGTGLFSVMLLFIWTLAGSILATLVIQKFSILRAVLLGGWKK